MPVVLSSLLPAALLSATYVLVRRDGHVPPLTPLYDGPYKVLQRSLCIFRLQIGNKQDTISTSRLKAVQEGPDVRPAEPRPRAALANRRSLRLAPASGSISSCPQLSWAPGGLHAITSLLWSRLFATWGEGTMKARSMASKLSPLVSQPGVSLFDHLPSCCTVLCCTVACI